MYSVKVAGIDEFRESRDVWNALVSSMAFPPIFCTWEWIYTWWEHFGDRYEPVILFVFKEKELAGILPLASRTEILRNDWLTGRILSYCGSQETAPDHIDIIAMKEEAVPCLEAIWKFLTSDFKEWDVLNLSHASDGSNIISWVKDRDRPFRAVVKHASVAPYIPLPKSFEEYTNQFGSKKRYNLKRDNSRLTDKKGVKYTSCDPERSHETLINLFSLHGQRAQRRKIVSTFQGPSVVDFHDALIKRIGNKDWIWLRSLEHEKKAIAVLYGFSYGGRIVYYQIGHDPEWECYGPGKVLMYNVIKEACDKNYGEFDFLRGNDEYKSFWTKEYRSLLAVNIYNKTFYGMLSRYLCHARSIPRKTQQLFTRGMQW